MLYRSDLRDYQGRAAKWIIDKPKSALWVEPGLGKTISSLTAILDLMNSIEVHKTLIIAPLRVALEVWEQEIKKWHHVRGLRAVQIAGLATPKARLAALQTPGDVYIMNYNILHWLTEVMDPKRWPFDLLVFDESSAYKGPSTSRTKAAKRISARTERVVQLTGTPASNSLMDLWPQIFMLDGGKRLGKTLKEYRKTYFKQAYNGFGNNWALKPGSEEIIYDNLADICLTMKGDEYVKLPDRIDIEVRVSLPTKARAMYEKLKEELVIALQRGDVTAVNGAALSGKLLQIANGAVYLSSEDGFEVLHDEKMNATAEIIENSSRGVLIFYQYRHDLARLRKRFPGLVEIRDGKDVLQRWNNEEIPILAAHPQSAGHGINAQHGGNTMIWFGMGWSLEHYEQACKRLHRSGQKEKVTIHHIIAHGTIEELVVKALKGKAKTQNALMDALKEDILGQKV